MKISFLKSVSVFVILFLFNCLTYSQVNSPWKWVHPTPQGNTLRYVKTFNATTYYAIGYAGTFLKTTNSGTNWFITTNVFGTQENGQLFAYCGWFFDQNIGLAGGESGKLARTTNAGLTWDTITTGESGIIYGMHFINANTGFFSTSTGGNIRKTTNAGLNWTAISTGASATLYSVFALNNDTIFVTTTAGNIRYTTNGGTNWTIQSTGASVTLYDVHFKDGNTGWVCGSSTAIRVTTNGGLNWTQTSTGLPTSTFYDVAYASGVTDADYVYVAGNSFYAFRSSNYGTTWDSVSIVGSQTYVSTMYSVDRNANNMAIVGAFGLINTSTNGGANWTAHNSLDYSGTLNDIWCDNMNGRVIAVGSAAQYPIIVSTNGGSSWIFNTSTNVTFTCYGIKMLNPTTGYVTGASSKLAKTTNGGMNWDTSTVYSTSTTMYNVDFPNANTGWISAASGRIFKTTNAGVNWELQTTGITNTLYNIDMLDANTGWFVGTTGTIRKTTDGGTTWTAQTPGTTSSLYDVQMFDANTGYLCGLSGTVRKTTNGGDNWDTVAVPFTSSLYMLSFSNVNTGFIAGATGLTYRTSNGGAAWQVLNTSGSTTNGIYAKGYDSAFAVASLGGIFKVYNPLTGGITWNNEIPVQYTLSQNYPNPFNPRTVIKFGLPKAARVTLKIYDILGKEVEAVFNNMQFNAGTVSFDFDGTRFASGVYFYSLIVNDEKIDTKKMVLVK
ncbi:MAG: T9SS type A sorting domain-containing protein [Ignavibacteria bacterium]|nr:T9SS type A sorting domain-containing protein [Ignavibacteria bacterium]